MSKLSDLRRRAGLTTEELARRAGVSYNTLAAHQRRGFRYGWRAENLLRVARVLAERLNMSVEEVISLLAEEEGSMGREEEGR